VTTDVGEGQLARTGTSPQRRRPLGEVGDGQLARIGTADAPRRLVLLVRTIVTLDIRASLAEPEQASHPTSPATQRFPALPGRSDLQNHSRSSAPATGVSGGRVTCMRPRGHGGTKLNHAPTAACRSTASFAFSEISC